MSVSLIFSHTTLSDIFISKGHTDRTAPFGLRTAFFFQDFFHNFSQKRSLLSIQPARAPLSFSILKKFFSLSFNVKHTFVY